MLFNIWFYDKTQNVEVLKVPQVFEAQTMTEQTKVF